MRWPSTSTSTALQRWLPRGGALPDRVWEQRHQAICVLLWLHAVALPVIGVLRGDTVLHSVAESGVVAALAVAAQVEGLGRTARAVCATLGLLASSALLVHLFEGLIEMHFHFFVIVAVVSLYQAWTPYLLGIAFVVVQHAAMGLLAPHEVYNHSSALANPAGFALVHGAFIVAESLACLMFWRFTEDTLDAERERRTELEESHEALSQANRQISDMVAMLSHDLRTPLAVVNGFATVALQTWPHLDDDQRREFMERISRSARALDELLEDTLAASALEAGRLEPRPQAVVLDHACRQVLDALSVPLTDVELVGLDRVAAYVDLGHLKQALTNVVSNAAKYGAPPYRITAATTDDAVLITVSDAGRGVPPDFVPHLFDRFSRAERARSGSQKGSGLGLFIAKSLMGANGGDIAYERAASGGSAFQIRLPRADAPAAAGQRPTSPRTAIAPSA